MATYPRQNLVRDVLIELGVLDANESPSAADYVTVNDRAQQIMEALYEEGLIPFDLDAAIPGRYMRPLVKVIAGELVANYGVSSRADLLLAQMAEGVRELWKLRDRQAVESFSRATYF